MQLRMTHAMTGPDGGLCRVGELVEVDAETAQRWLDGGVAQLVPEPTPEPEPAPAPAPKSRKSTAAPSGE